MARIAARESMFGENFKYVLVLTFLAWMSYTLPSVRAAVQDAAINDASESLAASGRIMAPLMNSSSSPMMNKDSRMQPAPEARMKKEMTPQQVVTLLYKLGFIAQDKLDAARVAVEHYSMGSSTPPLPCIASTTPSIQQDGLSQPCGGSNKPGQPRMGTTTMMGRPALQPHDRQSPRASDQAAQPEGN
jgi:hypothetical protein